MFHILLQPGVQVVDGVVVKIGKFHTLVRSQRPFQIGPGLLLPEQLVGVQVMVHEEMGGVVQGDNGHGQHERLPGIVEKTGERVAEGEFTGIVLIIDQGVLLARLIISQLPLPAGIFLAEGAGTSLVGDHRILVPPLDKKPAVAVILADFHHGSRGGSPPFPGPFP